MDYRDVLAWQRTQEDLAEVSLTAPVMLCEQNPQRVGLVLSSDTSTEMFFSTQPTNYPARSGIQIGPGNNPIVLSHFMHGALVQMAWWIWGTAGEHATAVELIMDNPPRIIIKGE